MATTQPATSPRAPEHGGRVRVATAGVHGFGAVHLRTIAELAKAGLVELVAVADPVPASPGTLPNGVRVFPSLPELLAAVEVDIVTIATPIHTHLTLARAAMEAGADVLLEKPPVPSHAEFEELMSVARATGRRCQVGFQSLGSDALPALRDMIAAGRLGDIRGIAGLGLWLRNTDYWSRSDWAGHRVLGGVEVMDGVVTNPLAHAVMTALSVAGSDTLDDVATVETELFRANPIEADDTSVVRVRTANGIPVVLAFTLCAPEQIEPTVTVFGSRGSAVLHYISDDLQVSLTGEPTEHLQYERTDLLANLIAHRSDPSVGLLAPLERTGAFMRVVESVRSAPPPAAIDPEFVTWVTDKSGRHPVVRDIGHWLGRASEELSTLRELNVPWARDTPDLGGAAPEGEPNNLVLLGAGESGAPEMAGEPGGVQSQELLTMIVAERTVAVYVDGGETHRTSSPRPYLHPVRTLGGVGVSDAHPPDHDWHLGVGVAIQDVAGANLWGGRTYVRDEGYVWRHDHGRTAHRGWVERSDSHAVEELEWLGPDSAVLLRERRTLRWSRVDEPGLNVWALDLGFTLSPAGEEPVELGSPGSNGRSGGGYGGFFWRLPHSVDVDVRTADASGESAVHGSRADWLAWSATFAGGDATIVSVPLDAASADDPWFVRQSDYPGFGSSLAWDEPLKAAAHAPVVRRFRSFIADGRLTNSSIALLAARHRAGAYGLEECGARISTPGSSTR